MSWKWRTLKGFYTSGFNEKFKWVKSNLERGILFQKKWIKNLILTLIWVITWSFKPKMILLLKCLLFLDYFELIKTTNYWIKIVRTLFIGSSIIFLFRLIFQPYIFECDTSNSSYEATWNDNKKFNNKILLFSSVKIIITTAENDIIGKIPFNFVKELVIVRVFCHPTYQPPYLFELNLKR